MINNPPRVCVVGLGPAGIGAALTLSRLGKEIDLICIDAGNPPTERFCNELLNKVCDQEGFCQVTCGFGGCAFVSGGKLSDFPAGKGLSAIYGSEEKAKKSLNQALKLISKYLPLNRPTPSVLEIQREKEFFAKLGFDYRYYDAYLCKHKNVVEAFKTIFKELNNWASLFMRTELVDVKRSGNGFDLTIKRFGKIESFSVDFLVLAVGRSGRKMLKALGSCLGLDGQHNCLDVGVRLEFPTKLYNQKVKAHNDLKLLFGNARTFCVCRDGEVIHYYSHGIQLTEGRCTNSQKTGNTNIGIIVRLPPSAENENLCSQIQEKAIQINNGKVVAESLLSYMNPNKKECLNIRNDKDSVLNSVDEFFPEPVKTNIRKAIEFFANRFFSKSNWEKIRVYAPEIDYGGMLFPLSNDFSVARNMYIIGDGSGRFRGILQSLGSGIYCAEQIIGDLNERSH